MSKKEDLFGKLNIKDYNNYLEEVLETKSFSSDTKNFLLSILYKVETAYNDYYTVKSLNKSKREFVEEIIEIIKDNCEKIELIKPSSQKYSKFQKKKEQCSVNKEKKEIISLYNEQVLLYAIFKLGDKEYQYNNGILKNPLQELLNTGKNINNKEVIRDFDGWAWHIETKQIEDIECNLVFQNISMLVEDKIDTEKQIKEALNKIYKKEDTEKIYILLNQIALIMYLNNHSSKKESFETAKLELQKELDEMEDKDNYFKKISKKAKKLENRIKNIDKCLKDAEYLKEEYIKTNAKLKENEKIFSISDFEEIIQNERIQSIYNLHKCNEKMLLEAYKKQKEKLKESIKILEVISSRKGIYSYILELQKEFIKGLQEKIKKVETRIDIMEVIYKLRYYKFLPYKDMQIKDVEELKDSIYKTEEMLYNVACKMNVINQISINEKVNTYVLRNVLETNIIELENIELLFKAENYQIVLKIYDEENIEKILEYDTIKGLTARINRKFRLFNK